MVGCDAGEAASVKVKPDDVAEPPSALVTVTGATPALRAGVMTVIDVADWLVTRPSTPPKDTLTPVRKSEPAMVTTVPPSAGPLAGLTAAMIGVEITTTRTSLEYALWALALLNARTAK